ncbi:DUF2142 domain-containing protein [Plantibacter cousiniae]|uniref:Predicted membrane protein n=1 Tax=Plantibacter cousiniae (nom. nud.) TaxID=199709 RepID=A0ABY1LT92_9MICO|nr:DUF2142 domain-containing protein [Plantibacter cousiniae]SKC74378.1 Predicted membrane protein [Plantibacter cousiniae]
MDSPARSSAPTRWERRRWLTFLLAFVTILAPMVLWALASPIGSIPDEPSHAIRAAAVARGELVSVPWPENPSLTEATVPENIANAHQLVCFAFDGELTADCQAGLRDRDEDLVTTGSSAGLNSPAFYAIVGWPSLVVTGDAAFYAMRIAGAAVCALALAVMVMQLTLLPRWRWAMVGAIVGVTPMVLYLSGSLNPNGLEVAAAGGLFATLLAMTRGTATGRRLWEQAGLALVTASLLMTTRSISLLWVLLIVVAAIFLGNRPRVAALLKSPPGLALLVGAAVVGLVTVAWYLQPPALAGSAPASLGIVSYLFAAGYTFIQSIDWVFGMIGFFGWVDTPAPSATIIAWSAALLLLLSASVVWGRRRTTVAVWGLLVVCLVVPVLTTLSVYAQYGYIWQGRYMLAMLLCLVIVAGLALDDAGVGIGADRRIARFVVGGFVLLAIGHLFAFVMTLRRYAVGIDGDFGRFVFDPSWEPPIGWRPLSVALLLVLVVAVWLSRKLFLGAPDHRAVEPSADRLDDQPSRTTEKS